MGMLTIRVQRKNEKEPCFPDLGEKLSITGTIDRVAILEAGMQSGKTSLMFGGMARVPHEGRFIEVWIGLEMSASQFEALGGAVRGAEMRFKEHPIE